MPRCGVLEGELGLRSLALGGLPLRGSLLGGSLLRHLLPKDASFLERPVRLAITALQDIDEARGHRGQSRVDLTDASLELLSGIGLEGADDTDSDRVTDNDVLSDLDCVAHLINSSPLPRTLCGQRRCKPSSPR